MAPSPSDKSDSEALLQTPDTDHVPRLLRPRALALGLVAVLASLAVTLGLLWGRSVAVTTPGQEPRGWETDTMQAIAMDIEGRPLTADEMQRVQGALHSKRHQLEVKAGRPMQKVRSLQLGWVAEESPKDKELARKREEQRRQQAEEDSKIPAYVSPACRKAMKTFPNRLVGKMTGKLLVLGIEMSIACAHEESKSCKKVEQKMDKVDNDIVQSCRQSGDLCKLTEVMHDYNESEEICQPKVCHKHADMAEIEETAALRQETNCSDCRVVVECR